MFKEISPNELNLNPVAEIGERWMLITAEKDGKANTMTASWGGVGVMWNKPVVTCYIRPQRYTREFVDSAEYFSICFFDDEYKDALTLCGKYSGKDFDKISKSGLTVASDGKAPYFEQANTVLVCRKLYRQEMKPECFIEPKLDANYPSKDYHIMYLGEIVQCLKK